MLGTVQDVIGVFLTLRRTFPADDHADHILPRIGSFPDGARLRRTHRHVLHRLWARNRQLARRVGTRWKIAWIPLGGYVKFFGDMNAASTPDRERLSTLSAEERRVALPLQTTVPARADCGSRSRRKFRAGDRHPGRLSHGAGHLCCRSYVSSVQPGSAAAQAGFLPGDTILVG